MIQNKKSNITPYEITSLTVDDKGPLPQAIWSYYLVFNMLLYFPVNYCKDISISVNQCAQYSHNPHRLHEVDFKRRVHYLISKKY